MALPPASHPAWPMVMTIGFAGASTGAFMGGNLGLAITFIAIAAFFAAMSRRAVRRMRGE